MEMILPSSLVWMIRRTLCVCSKMFNCRNVRALFLSSALCISGAHYPYPGT
ncbi:hypothetical protein GBAR_LOCUS11550 [Geodia barretti]|uniref:Uncharacterized protein n=1 Tax=Geodia barretti TaxID=519541 RepID=A0AA35WF64_GEOBA|nr:hypothetical protein GBAR_LOCUS11550 [Geodia barretti]